VGRSLSAVVRGRAHRGLVGSPLVRLIALPVEWTPCPLRRLLRLPVGQDDPETATAEHARRHKPSQTARHSTPVLLRGLRDASLCHGLDVN
jgi:hypothetical protein